MPDERNLGDVPRSAPADQRGADGEDLVLAALGYVRGGLPSGGGASGPPTLARQKENLRRWAAGLGLLLSASDLPAKVVRGGQEHEIFHDEATDRYLKITRHGVFGFSPGIELALVSSSAEGRRFHLWEATPLEYLERLYLQNLLVPGLNRIEGIIDQPGDEMAIVTSQPRFEIVPVSAGEIDGWFASQGFSKVAEAAYYRAEDNLGIFDAHEKNLVRAGELLVPFDVIPCHPGGGFLEFIRESLIAGHKLKAVRSVSGESPGKGGGA